MTPERHLESRDVAAYVDRALDPAERDSIEAHLADCTECRNEIIQVTRLRRVAGVRRKWWFVIPAAAAAVLAIVLLPSKEPGGPVLRDGPPELGPALILVVPTDSALSTLSGPPTSFTWRSLDSVVSYRVTIADDSGDVVWTATSGDTAVQMPASIRLRLDRRYFWFVDALLPDGRSVASDVRTFGTQR